jgi:hypothetical protein
MTSSSNRRLITLYKFGWYAQLLELSRPYTQPPALYETG